MIRELFLYPDERPIGLRQAVRTLYLLAGMIIWLPSLYGVVAGSLSFPGIVGAYFVYLHLPVIALFWTPLVQRRFLPTGNAVVTVLVYLTTVLFGPVPVLGYWLVYRHYRTDHPLSPVFASGVTNVLAVLVAVGALIGLFLVYGVGLSGMPFYAVSLGLIGLFLVPAFTVKGTTTLSTDASAATIRDRWSTSENPLIQQLRVTGYEVRQEDETTITAMKERFNGLLSPRTVTYNLEQDDPITFDLEQDGDDPYSTIRAVVEEGEETRVHVVTTFHRRLPVVMLLFALFNDRFTRRYLQELAYTVEKESTTVHLLSGM
ncbi:MAG: hypothetical protein SV186_05425 [Candidatus Nanohaloarchaea archaeon]|nr:hypothetical protein [Candidatus Nanohaloarchaea archaeon]